MNSKYKIFIVLNDTEIEILIVSSYIYTALRKYIILCSENRFNLLLTISILFYFLFNAILNVELDDIHLSLTVAYCHGYIYLYYTKYFR